MSSYQVRASVDLGAVRPVSRAVVGALTALTAALAAPAALALEPEELIGNQLARVDGSLAQVDGGTVERSAGKFGNVVGASAFSDGAVDAHFVAGVSTKGTVALSDSTIEGFHVIGSRSMVGGGSAVAGQGSVTLENSTAALETLAGSVASVTGAGDARSFSGGVRLVNSAVTKTNADAFEQIAGSLAQSSPSQSASGGDVTATNGLVEITQGSRIDIDVNAASAWVQEGSGAAIARTGAVLASDSTLTGWVAGASAIADLGQALATGGTVSVVNVRGQCTLIGGWAMSRTGAQVHDNSVGLDNSSADLVVGGYASAGDDATVMQASGNSVTLIDSTVGVASGAKAELGVASSFKLVGNAAYATGGKVNAQTEQGAQIYGASVGATQGGALRDFVVTGNTADVSDGAYQSVVGAELDFSNMQLLGGEATGNRVLARGAEFKEAGGTYARTGGSIAELAAGGSLVAMSGGRAQTLFGTRLYAGSDITNTSVGGNAVSIAGDARISRDVFGSQVQTEGTIENVSAGDNAITVTSGEVVNVYGAHATAQAISSHDASEQAVSLQLGGNRIALGSADGQTVVTGTVCGACLSITGQVQAAQVGGNTIWVDAAHTDLTEAILMGSFVSGANVARIDQVTGNVLAIDNIGREVAVAGLTNFERLDLTVDAAAYAEWGDSEDHALVRIGQSQTNETASMTRTQTASGAAGAAQVHVTVRNPASLTEGAAYTILAGTDQSGGAAGGYTLTGMSDETGLIDFVGDTQSGSDGSLSFTLTGKRASGAAGSIVNAPVLAAAMMLDASFMSGQTRARSGLFALASVRRDETALNADTRVTSTSLTAGAAGDFALPAGSLGVAGFLEAGQGDFESAAGASSGEGDGTFAGAGVQASLVADTGLYTQLDARLGYARMNATSRIAQGASFASDYAAIYWSARAEAGFDWQVAENLTVTPYAAYTYLQLASDETQVRNLSYEWDGVAMHKLSAGAHVSYAKANWNWRAGAAYENILAADIDSTYAGVAMQTWDMSGRALLVKLGLARASEDGKWSVRAAVNARLGDWHGAAGSLNVIRRW